jgi:conjugal transfer pilus assembly protein TraV
MNDMIKALLPMLLLMLGGCAVKGEYSCGVPDNGVRCQPMTATHEQLNDGTLVSLHTDPFPDDSEVQTESGHETDYFSDDEMALETNTSTRASTPHRPTLNEADARIAQPSILSIRSKQAVLSAPREMRIWFNRFTDPDGDLHDESFVFVRIDNGHWTIDNKPVLY